MRFDENLRQFVYEYEGIIFAWDEEPGEDFPDTVKKLGQIITKGLMTSSGILPPI